MARKTSVRKEDGARDEAALRDSGPDSRAELGSNLAAAKASRADALEGNNPDPAVEALDANASAAFYQRWLEEKKTKGKKLRDHAQPMFKAMEMWPIYAANEDQWVELCENTWDEYHSGRFFLEQLGAERFIEPRLFATLWMLRNSLIEDIEPRTVAEVMLIDMMMIGYANTLRTQGWVGNLALQIESEFFDEHGLHERYDVKNGRSHTERGLIVQSMLERMREQLLPLLDRCNRMTIRNLRAIQELRRGPAPTVAIGKADQVNVAQQQINSR